MERKMKLGLLRHYVEFLLRIHPMNACAFLVILGKYLP